MAPRKVRAVIDLVRGKQVDAALQLLALTNKQAMLPVKKLIDSAIANATNNFKLNRKDLYIAEIYANEGPTAYRWMPRAFGRATSLRQRSSHVHIVLDDRSGKTVAAVTPVVQTTEPAVKQSAKVAAAEASAPDAPTSPTA